MRAAAELVALAAPYAVAVVVGWGLNAAGSGAVAYLFSAALAALFAVLYGFMMPWKYSVENGVVRLCSPLRCVEYDVVNYQGEAEGELWRRWLFNMNCVGWRSTVSVWEWCGGGELYFATRRCRDKWRIYQVREEDYVFKLWLCDDGKRVV